MSHALTPCPRNRGKAKQFKYDASFHDSELEPKIDKLLDCYDTIARLYYSGHLLKLKDLEFIAYDLLVVCQDQNIRAYFAVLDEWFRARGMTTRPFHSFRAVSVKLKKKFFVKRAGNKRGANRVRVSALLKGKNVKACHQNTTAPAPS